MNALRSFDGTRISWCDEKGEGHGPPALLSHGTGFNAGVWLPLVQRLKPDCSRILSIDHRNHGRSQGGSMPVSWWDSARDLGAVAGEARAPVIGIGHSMGGATLVLAALCHPDLFSGLVLIEPIVVPPPFRRDLDHPIIEMTRRRRPQFESVAAARGAVIGAFSVWDPVALEGYLDRGLEVGEELVRLTCTPRQEVDTYRAGFSSGAIDHLSRLATPVRILVGAHEDTYPLGWAEELAGLCQDGMVEVVEGANHFLPMSHSVAVAEAYRRMAEGLTPR